MIASPSSAGFSLGAAAFARAAADVTIGAERESDIPTREALLDRAMGANRRRKASEAIRRGRAPAKGLSLVARSTYGAGVGTVRLWHVAAGETNAPALLLGPLAVASEFEGAGVGSALMRRAIAEAQWQGHGAIILVGDPEYYGRFGFSAEPAAALSMPGPFERHRLLGLELQLAALGGAHGLIRATGTRLKVAAGGQALSSARRA